MSNVVNAEVVAKPNESGENLIRRFLKKVKKLGLFEEFRKYEYYKKPSVKNKEAAERRKRVLLKLEAQEKGIPMIELLNSKGRKK